LLYKILIFFMLKKWFNFNVNKFQPINSTKFLIFSISLNISLNSESDNLRYVISYFPFLFKNTNFIWIEHSLNPSISLLAVTTIKNMNFLNKVSYFQISIQNLLVFCRVPFLQKLILLPFFIRVVLRIKLKFL